MESTTIFESLQREFCPPLDSSLLAAMFADIDLTSPSASHHIAELRKDLLLLAEQADAESQSTFGDDFDFSASDESLHDFCTNTTTTTTTSFSDSSSFNSPLGFLIATMPHIPEERLRNALGLAKTATAPDEEIDMWEVIATILSEETEREMRERDLDEREYETKTAWETSESKKSIVRKPKKNKGNKITVSDVRQQQNLRPMQTTRALQVDDRWTQLASISTHVAKCLPPHQPAFFQRYFHSPQHASTPYNALCAALFAITTTTEQHEGEHTATLFGLLDFLLPSHEDLDENGRTRLCSDVELALAAAQGRGEDALELVRIMRELDIDASQGHFEMGVYHSPVPSKLFAPQIRASSLANGPAPTAPPPKLARAVTAPAPSTSKPSPYQWQAVAPRRRVAQKDVPYSHAMHIPTYHTDVNGSRSRPRAGGNADGKGGKGDVGELGAYRRRIGDAVRKRDESLREAARMWQRGKGNKKGRGGEVALYFAEQARKYSEIARQEALDGAREIVQAKRFSSRNHDTVDLHGLTAAEAITIVKEILEEQIWSSDKPLRVITGRGTHSAGQVSVLKPAVRRSLEEEGWLIGQWDGGLTVRGRRPASSFGVAPSLNINNGDQFRTSWLLILTSTMDWRQLRKGFETSVQATKERLGRVKEDEITELPQEYKELETRVDALRQAHITLLKITKVFESEAYDYPSAVSENFSEFSTSLGHGITSFAATNLKGTKLPAPAPPPPVPTPEHKTLPHALVRSARSASALLQTSESGQDQLGNALDVYAAGMDKVAAARVEQDQAIRLNHLHPWQQTLNTSINVAMKARQAVRTSRLELDGAKQTLKNASPAKQEHARLEVENAEDDLVQKTEVAISLMQKVLQNPEPIKHLNELAKAQLIYHAIAAETLSNTQAELEELSNSAEEHSRFSLQPLLEALEDDDAHTPLEESIDSIIPEFLRQRAALQAKQSQVDAHGQTLRPLTRSDVSSLLTATANVQGGSWAISQAIAIRKLKLAQKQHHATVAENQFNILSSPNCTEMPSSDASTSQQTRAVIHALESIKSTPYSNSFLARLQGVPTMGVNPPGLVSVDWETVTPWMSLMSDIRQHFTLAHPERETPSSMVSPIMYTALQPWHLGQVHNLLERAFWSGIDVRDSLDYSPERCTIVATYGRLVVGVAIMSSPRETYITYLTVRAGWDNAHIATTMLYHLITLNPHQDITLHVSAKNSAMLLYNRFGFKAEGFIAGFYETYLDPQSRASKNAFRLRLRQH
ncbi:Cytoplasmic protein [Mycena indigotica]|uniref:Cytoplasmic protein n=1 Tax=Mycena indigotica TaxID=2126181 RepID=A0A8H6W894_9AGAR|nr:Cytoplasmic protein [Mycena indigotica]KAF7309449.1 Cytoplasmic protein [Mycena indigotica]